MSGRILWSKEKVFLPVITPYHIPAGERLFDVLSWKIDLIPGEVELIGLAELIDLNGERILLKTTPLRIRVEGAS